MRQIRVQEFSVYIDEYKNLVYTICFSFVKNTFDAEDLAQETFISAYQHLSSFDDRNPKSWLAQIAANKCRDFLKSPARRITAVDSDDLEYICDEREGVEAEVERRAEMDEFAALCNRLKEPYRAVAVAYYCLDKTISEIGEETEANTKTVATRLYRAKKLLRTIMREDSSWSCLLTNT